MNELFSSPDMSYGYNNEDWNTEQLLWIKEIDVSSNSSD
ncbi:hypothetical protein PBI_PEREGRIN_36 [Rhodococcus phage Peregrin]|nr:hypothetical protein PBI_PEREGRIN_36 [Rhodococcus phage Peregrin]